MRRVPLASLLLLSCLAMGSSGVRPADVATTCDEACLTKALRDYAKALADGVESVAGHKAYRGDLDQAAGAAYLTRQLLKNIESKILQESDFPFFRVLDFRIRDGGDSADQKYLMAEIRGGETYRIWGTRGNHRRLDFQIYAGEPWSKQGGRVTATVASDDLRLAPDGSFEIFVGPERPSDGGNWLHNPSDGTTVIVRQIFGDWSKELPGEVHIDRVGHEGDPKPPIDRAEMARRLSEAAGALRANATVWPDFVDRLYFNEKPENWISRPSDPSRLGGLTGRWMASGNYRISEDEALILKLWHSGSANYVSVQLIDVWMSSLEYANRQSMLNLDQAHRSADGAYYFVISRRDPGIQNWLDTVGTERGAILVRYDGMRGRTIPPEEFPTLKKIRLSELAENLPAATPRISAEQRAKALTERRRHVQRRFGI